MLCFRFSRVGEHLKERELISKMGISTTPIKEAIRILSYEGLFESVPQR
ncbi:GntR family transcriptional regulator [Pseudogracilibacillus sp. SO30301A]